MNIVIIASIPYTFPLYQRIHHFTNFFVDDGHKVLFIEPTKFTQDEKPRKNLEVWHPRIGGADAFYWLEKKKRHWIMNYRGAYRFFQLARFLGGFRLYRFIRNNYERQIHKVTHQMAFEDKMGEKIGEYSHSRKKIAFFQFPHNTEQIPLMKRLGYKIVYDMVDDIAEFEEVPKDIREKEILLLKNSDLVITTSQPLAEMASKYNKNIKLIPNGVEYKHFVKARGRLPRPRDMPKGKPIVGYYGAIWTWFDGDLLLYLAKKRPQYDFVLIGTLLERLRGKFSGQKNIYYLDEKKYSALPNYLRHFDLAIIPFKSINLTKCVNPVKAYEYLAGGKNVLYSGLTGMDEFPCVFRASDKNIPLQVDKLLKKRFESKKADKFLKKNDWEQRHSVLMEQLSKL